MRGRTLFGLCLLFLALVLSPSCQEIINYPAPSLVSLSPNNYDAGDPPFTLTVTGYNFTPASAILWNNLPLTSGVFVSQNVMTAVIPASFVATPGQVSVTIETPQPGGGIAQPPLTFTINPTQSQIPLISSISPTSMTAYGALPTLYVYGSNFVSLSTVAVNGSNRVTTVVSTTELQAVLLSSDTANSGVLQISVVNPPPGGGSSNLVSLPVNNPVPSLTALTPTGVLAGSVTPTLTITGSAFVPNSYITINGVQRPTIFAGATSLSTTLTSADVSFGGVNQVRVVNPSPGGGTSNLVTFPVNPATTVGLPALEDLDPYGYPALEGICGSCSGTIPTLANAGPSLNSNGQFMAFASISSNLLLNQTTTTSSVFLRSTCLSQGSSCVPRTFIGSVTSSGGIANGPSWEPSLDSSGSHVAYTSEATNLVTTTNVPSGVKQVYWSPVCTSTAGCSNSTGPVTTLVSTAADGVSPGNGDSYNPVISPDGQYVAFTSLATNLVANVFLDGVTPQVFIRNTCNGTTTSGCTPTTYLVSSPDLATPGNGPSFNPAISNDGLYVSFTSTATNLGATAPNPGGGQEIFTRSTCVTTLGESTNTCTPITYLASTPDGVTPAGGSSLESALSGDGRFVAFASTATNLGTASGGVQQIFVRDTCNNVVTTTCTPSTILVSSPDGSTAANGMSEHPTMNRCGGTGGSCVTGQFVAFASVASNLGVNVSPGVENVFVRNACLGVTTSTTVTCTPATNLASQPAGTSPPPSNGNNIVPAISGDGHSVGFISFANNLVPYLTSGFQDVFLGPTNF